MHFNFGNNSLWKMQSITLTEIWCRNYSHRNCFVHFWKNYKEMANNIEFNIIFNILI